MSDKLAIYDPMCVCGHPRSVHSDPEPRYAIEFSPEVKKQLKEEFGWESKKEPKPPSDKRGWLCSVIVNGWTCPCKGFEERTCQGGK